MTEVAFHFNLPDKLGYTCRLLRKAVGAGAKVVVTAEDETLRQLDVALWTFSSLDFVSHGFEHDDPTVLAASAVVLAKDAGVTAAPHRQVLVNLGQSVPSGFASYERLVEVVGPSDVDRNNARQRWKHYSDRGYNIVRHDLASKGIN